MWMNKSKVAHLKYAQETFNMDKRIDENTFRV